MKKIVLLAATIFLVGVANAQSLRLQSAITDLKNKRLDRAKENIDAASVHENTKDDAKTWRYKAEIYLELSKTTDAKYKALSDNPLEVSFDATLKSKELDKSKEFDAVNSVIMQQIGITVFNQGVKKIETKEYADAMNLFDKAVQINLAAGNGQNATNARLYAGVAAEYLHDTVNMIKNYQAVINTKFKDIFPYITLYNLYKGQNDTIKAKRVAESAAKTMDTNYRSYILLADAYALVGDNANFKTTLQKVLAMKPNDTIVLNAIGGAYEQNKEYDVAIEKYSESLKISPNQYAANFQLGAMYFNQGVDKFTEANKVPDDDNAGLFDKFSEEGKDLFKKAISYLEKASDVNRKDENSLRALKSIYARLGDTENTQKINKRLEELQ